jgi:hypothetical protein
MTLPSQLTVTNAITALGALGTASFGLVDATKAAGGGISRVGVSNIKEALLPLFGPNPSPNDRSTPLTYASVLDNLRANWMNGTDLAAQKAIAKTLIKLRLSAATAPVLAAATGVDPAELTTIANKINEAEALTPPEADAFGRFDLALTSLFDQAYQRADQRYRNSAKILAGLFSILIAFFAGFLYSLQNGDKYGATLYDYLRNSFAYISIAAGAIATPIAPIAKDLTSALAAGTDVLQKLRKAA